MTSSSSTTVLAVDDDAISEERPYATLHEKARLAKVAGEPLTPSLQGISSSAAWRQSRILGRSRAVAAWLALALLFLGVATYASSFWKRAGTTRTASPSVTPVVSTALPQSTTPQPLPAPVAPTAPAASVQVPPPAVPSHEPTGASPPKATRGAHAKSPRGVPSERLESF